MKVEGPPLHPSPPRVIPNFSDDPAHNRRELDAANQKAMEIGGVVSPPAGEWYIGPPI
jgi:hypothetical protein